MKVQPPRDLLPGYFPICSPYNGGVRAISSYSDYPDRLFPKHPMINEVLGDIVGKRSLCALFNHGFTLSQIMTLVPNMMDKVLFFLEKLSGFASTGKTFKNINEVTTSLSHDTIGKVVLGQHFNSQTQHNEIEETFTRCVSLT
jgi:hypothetical protein